MIKTIKLEKKGLDNIKLLSGAQLKYIAFLSMLIDHVNKALIYPILDGGLLLEISDFFDVISEIPFDMFFSRTFFNTRANNVLFTLALSLITIWIIDILKSKLKNKPSILWYFSSVVLILISSFISMQFGLDYEHYSIIIVYLFYIFYNNLVIGCALGYLTLIKTLWSILGFGLVLTYNGKRGNQNKIINYWFYPVHLLILGILRMYFKI